MIYLCENHTAYVTAWNLAVNLEPVNALTDVVPAGVTPADPSVVEVSFPVVSIDPRGRLT